MPDVQYPFIDIAVHPRIRERFARGEAMVLFSADLRGALWANGRGAALFGEPVIYDFIETGPRAQDVVFRQLSSARRQLAAIGDASTFTIRIRDGFRSVAAIATAELVRTGNGTEAVLFSVHPGEKPQPAAECARRMIQGFDDPDIHMAVLDDQGGIIASSPGFAALEMTGHTTGALVAMAANSPDRLIKRPVSTGKGYLPAAIGALSASPALNLLFAIDTAPAQASEAPAEPVMPDGIEAMDNGPVTTQESVPPAGYEAAIDAVYEIVEPDGEEENPVTALMEDHETVPAIASDSIENITEKVDEDTAGVMAAPSDVSEVGSAGAIPSGESDEQAKASKGFVFNPAARASRFVWKIDAAGRFSDVSHEFADAVGPKTAAVNGLTFSHVANIFDLDPDGRIAELLGKRDTWSGKTIYWPVEGTRLRVPIDLAALPTYTRSREFDGFRGFGIVRNSDVIDDPLETGLVYADNHDKDAGIIAEAPADMESAETVAVEEETATAATDDDNAPLDTVPEPVAARDDVAGDVETLPEGAEEAAPEPDTGTSDSDDAETGRRDARMTMPAADEWPAGEVPALRIMPTPANRHSDNVIRVEELRARAGYALTAGEQAAFHEIGRKLGPAEIEDSSDELEQEDDTPSVEVPEPAAEDAITDATAGAPVNEDLPAEAEDDAPHQADEITAAPVADNPAQLADVGRSRTLTPGILDEMPVALLVHTGDTLLHANTEFLRLTGYSSIDELEAAGGLDALLQRRELDDMPDSTGGMVAVGANDELIPVTARLKSVRWEETSALMLVLIPSGTREKSVPVSMVPVAAETVSGAGIIDADAADEDEAATDMAEEPLSVAGTDTAEGLRIEVEELRSILETATDGVVILDEDGNIRSMNRSASALFNYDNHETAGKPFVILFAHESQKSILEYLAGLAGQGVASVLNDGREVIGREASGGFLPLFMTIGRLKSSHGYCAVIRDVTHWKRTEDELRNARRSAETANAHKSDFLARVSHEIRTPLNAIIGFADMMATERFGPVGHPRYVEYANDIGRSGRHVLDIVNDLLDISKIEAGQMDLEFIAVGLNETVSETVALVQPQANNQRVIIRTSLSPAVPRVVADVRSIRQIVLNILSNAIRFTPSGGQIVVSTSYEANGNVVLRFRDTGIGMTRMELEQAMKPFQQVSAGTRLRGDGTGLGLPLTKAMVDANRATFSINSAPNEGTLVEIVFPPARVLAN